MGWKRVKEHYGIVHIVQVDTRRDYGNVPCIFIGSPYISDIIVIRMSDAAMLKRYDGGHTSDKLMALQPQLDEDAKNGTLKRLIDEPDKFGKMLPVYCIEDGRHIIEMQCEAYGYPNVTTSGRLMYNNTFVSQRCAASRYLLHRSKISPFWCEHVKGRFREIWRAIRLLRFEIGEIWTYVYVRCWGRFFILNEQSIKEKKYGKR